MENVILVDADDNPIGVMEKMEAHRKGVLHRAFSILIFNSQREMLIQKRAATKYHSGGLWTNACCSHPLPEESIAQATRRRLSFEMGIDVQPEFAYKFIYKAPLDKGLIEYELDHVFTSVCNDTPLVNPEEVDDWKYMALPELREDMQRHPEIYTFWFKIIINDEELAQHLLAN